MFLSFSKFERGSLSLCQILVIFEKIIILFLRTIQFFKSLSLILICFIVFCRGEDLEEKAKEIENPQSLLNDAQVSNNQGFLRNLQSCQYAMSATCNRSNCTDSDGCCCPGQYQYCVRWSSNDIWGFCHWEDMHP